MKINVRAGSFIEEKKSSAIKVYNLKNFFLFVYLFIYDYANFNI